MSVSIVEILAGDKGIDLQNGYWARQPSILGNWNTIRIGARIHVAQASDSGLVSTPKFRFGICAGMVNVPGKVVNANVDNALFYDTVRTTWTYSTGGSVLQNQSPSNQIGKIESGTAANVTCSGQTHVGAISSGADTIRVPLIVTITKGSPNFTFALDRRTSATSVDISLAQLYAAMESSSPSTSLGSGYSSNSNTIAMDEGTHGTLDTVFVTWGQSSPPIYVSEILVARLA